MKKLLVLVLAMIFGFTAMAEWNFRGTANSWASEAMTYNSTTGLYETTQAFSSGDSGGSPRFKIDRYGDWTESYPSADYIVSSNTTYDITVNPSTHEVIATESGQVDNWYFRGTANNWAATAMTYNESTGLYETTQVFGTGDGDSPRFKIDHYGDWTENYPTADYLVNANTEYFITFNASTKAIIAETAVVTPPAAPTGLVITLDYTSVDLTWTASNGASSYTVYQSSSATGTYTAIGTTNSTNYTVSGLTEGTRYYFEVTASNSAGESDMSTYVSGTTLILDIPSAPTGLAVSGETTSSLTVSWTAVSGAESYELYQSSSATGTYTSVGTTTSASYAVTGLAENTTYYYEVTARNAAGTSDMSAYVAGTTDQTPADTWYFRGTANSWGTTLMDYNSTTGLYETVQTFANGDGDSPRFKIDHYADWTENYPTADYVVNANTTYTITFNANTHEVFAVEGDPTTVTVSADPGTTSTTESSLLVTLDVTGENATAKYAVNADATNGTVYTAGTTITISLANIGDSVTLNLYGENTESTDTASYTYTRVDNTVSEDIDSLRIYQVMVESFIDGDSSRDYNTGYGPSHHKGDLRGVINALPYMKDLGMNAVWMTPIFNSNGGSQLDATGYFCYDYFNVDPKFGSLDDAKELVATAHSLGMYVFLDGVFGHHKGGEVAASPSGLYPQGGSDPVDYNQSETVEFYKEVATYWIDTLEIDGWRLDQAYQVPVWAWNQIRSAVEVKCADRKAQGKEWGTLGYMVGEIWKAESDIQNYGYGGNGDVIGLYSNFDFPLRYKAVQVFAAQEHTEQAGSMGQPASALNDGYDTHNTYASHAHPNFMLTNHDLVRFGDLIQRGYGYGKENTDYWKRHKLAFSFQAAFTGPITVYYGDEIGDEVGGFIYEGDGGYWDDHVSRSSGQINNFDSNQSNLRAYVQSLMTARAVHSSLWNGTRTNLVADTNVYADLKEDGNDKTVYVANVATFGNTATLSQSTVGGSQLVDLVSGDVIYASGGTYSVSLDSLTGRLFVVE